MDEEFTQSTQARLALVSLASFLILVGILSASFACCATCQCCGATEESAVIPFGDSISSIVTTTTSGYSVQVTNLPFADGFSQSQDEYYRKRLSLTENRKFQQNLHQRNETMHLQNQQSAGSPTQQLIKFAQSKNYSGQVELGQQSIDQKFAIYSNLPKK